MNGSTQVLGRDLPSQFASMNIGSQNKPNLPANAAPSKTMPQVPVKPPVPPTMTAKVTAAPSQPATPTAQKTTDVATQQTIITDPAVRAASWPKLGSKNPDNLLEAKLKAEVEKDWQDRVRVLNLAKYYAATGDKLNARTVLGTAGEKAVKANIPLLIEQFSADCGDFCVSVNTREYLNIAGHMYNIAYRESQRKEYYHILAKVGQLIKSSAN